jgi:hypothetical protein
MNSPPMIGAREQAEFRTNRRKIRLPDIDPTIAQAQAPAPASLASALKIAGFSVGALAFLIVVAIGWPQLSKFQRGQQIEIGSAKLPLG